MRRYLEVSPWNYSASDIVNGLIYYGLEQASANQKEAEEWGGLDNEGFHDGAWGYVEEEICAALRLRTGDLAEMKEEAVTENPSGDADDIKARFLTGDLPVPPGTLTVEARCGL